MDSSDLIIRAVTVGSSVVTLAGSLVVAWTSRINAEVALKTKLELLEATHSLRTAFEEEIRKLRDQFNEFKMTVDRDGIEERFCRLEKRTTLNEDDSHYIRNLTNRILSKLPEGDAIIEATERYFRKQRGSP